MVIGPLEVRIQKYNNSSVLDGPSSYKPEPAGVQSVVRRTFAARTARLLTRLEVLYLQDRSHVVLCDVCLDTSGSASAPQWDIPKISCCSQFIESPWLGDFSDDGVVRTYRYQDSFSSTWRRSIATRSFSSSNSYQKGETPVLSPGTHRGK